MTSEKGGNENAKTDIDIDKDIDKDIDTEDHGHRARTSSSASASASRREIDSYEEIYDATKDPVKLASDLCNDRDSRSRGGFGKQLKRVGDYAFRNTLAAFFGELRSGEEPRCRGAALMARLKALPSEAESIEAREAIAKIGG